jgi:hypothetical protein
MICLHALNVMIFLYSPDIQEEQLFHNTYIRADYVSSWIWRHGSVVPCLLFVFTATVVISRLLVVALIVSKHLVVASLSLVSWTSSYQTEVKVHRTVSVLGVIYMALSQFTFTKNIYSICQQMSTVFSKNFKAVHTYICVRLNWTHTHIYIVTICGRD